MPVALEALPTERNLRRLLTLIERPNARPGPDPRCWLGVLLPYSSATLIEVNALAARVADVAERAGLRHVMDSLPEGYGPLRLPAYTFSAGVQITDNEDRFLDWRAGVSVLLTALERYEQTSHVPVPASDGREHTTSGEATPPVPEEPDGPSEPSRFRWHGKVVDLSESPLRWRLVESLWDSSANAPHKYREQTAVMEYVYGTEEEEKDGAFKNLCTHVRHAFERAAVPLTVRTAGGKVWLQAI
jgi:hypothetical protein